MPLSDPRPLFVFSTMDEGSLLEDPWALLLTPGRERRAPPTSRDEEARVMLAEQRRRKARACIAQLEQEGRVTTELADKLNAWLHDNLRHYPQVEPCKVIQGVLGKLEVRGVLTPRGGSGE